jgi:YfiH family protein
MIETPIPTAVPRYEIEEWRDLGVVAGITGRGTGSASFDLGFAGTTPVGMVMDHWRRFQESLPDFRSVTVSRQVHGTAIRWHPGGEGLVVQYGLDGHATEAPGALIAITVADCVPVYLLDPKERRVCLLHAGWKGTAAGILPAGIQEMAAHGSSVDNLLMHCGIAICGCCYEVGHEVFAACGVTLPTGPKGYLDLREVLMGQARRAGVTNISTSPFCSAHDSDRFFSHRASRGADGRMVAYLGLVA